MLTPQEIAAGATGVGDLSFANPPQQGGFLRPMKPQMDPVEYDWELRRKAYDVLKSQGDPAADNSAKFEDVRTYYGTGVLPQSMQDLYTRQGRELPTSQQQAEPQQQQSGLFVKAQQQQQTEEQSAPQKPVYDFNQPTKFTPILVQDDAHAEQLKKSVEPLFNKYSGVISAAQNDTSDITNNGSKSVNSARMRDTTKLTPYLFWTLYGLNPDQANKLPVAVRRDMLDDAFKWYASNLTPEQLAEKQATGWTLEGSIANAKKTYGMDEKEDNDNSITDSIKTVVKGASSAAMRSVTNIGALLDGLGGDGDKETGLGQGVKYQAEFQKWLDEGDSKTLKAQKQTLNYYLSQDRVADAMKYVLSNPELLASIGGDLAGGLAADSAIVSGIGAGAGAIAGALGLGGVGAAPGAAAGSEIGAAVGTALGAGKAGFTLWNRLKNYASLVKKTAPMSVMQGIQSGGVMMADLMNDNKEITSDVRNLVLENMGINTLITGLIPGDLGDVTKQIADKVFRGAKAAGKEIPTESINKSAAELAKIITTHGGKVAGDQVTGPGLFTRGVGLIKGVGKVGVKSSGEAVQEGATVWNEENTRQVNQDGTIRELTPEEEKAKLTQAMFEGLVGFGAKVPHSTVDVLKNSYRHDETANAYKQQYENEDYEARVAQQSPEFQALYANSAKATPKERYEEAEATIAAQNQAQQAMQGAQQSTIQRSSDPTGLFTQTAQELENDVGFDVANKQYSISYDPLHTYFNPTTKDRKAYADVVSLIDNTIQSAEGVDANIEQELADIQDRLKNGDLSAVNDLQTMLVDADKSYIFDGVTGLAKGKKAIPALTTLSQNQKTGIGGISTNTDGLKRFSDADRQAVKDQLIRIQGDATGIDTTDLNASIANVRNRLSTAQDSMAKQIAEDHLNALEKIVSRDQAELTKTVGRYFTNAAPKSTRYQATKHNAFTDPAMETRFYDNVKRAVDHAKNAGVDDATRKQWMADFDAVYKQNPAIALNQLNQNISGWSRAQNMSPTQQRGSNFLNPQQSQRYVNQVELTNVVDALSQSANELASGALGQVNPVDVNSRIFGNITPNEAGQITHLVGAIKQTVKPTLFNGNAPTQTAYTKNPIQQLQNLQEDLAKNPGMYSGLNGGTKIDLDQIKAYVDSTLAALTSGDQLPKPSPYMEKLGEAFSSKLNGGEFFSSQLSQADMAIKTGDNYTPKPLWGTQAGDFLRSVGKQARDALQGIEVVHTPNGVLIYANNVNIPALTSVVQQGQQAVNNLAASAPQAQQQIQQLGTQAVQNLAANTSNTPPSGTVGVMTQPQTQNVAQAVVQSSVHDFNAQQLIAKIQETDRYGNKTGLKDFLQLIYNDPKSGYHKHPLIKALINLANGVNSKGAPIANAVSLPNVVAIKNLNTDVQARYFYKSDGIGTLEINESLADDSSFHRTVVHELLHWAISQNHLGYLEGELPAAYNVMVNLFSAGGSYSKAYKKLGEIVSDTTGRYDEQIKEAAAALLAHKNDSTYKPPFMGTPESNAQRDANAARKKASTARIKAQTSFNKAKEDLAKAQQALDEHQGSEKERTRLEAALDKAKQVYKDKEAALQQANKADTDADTALTTAVERNKTAKEQRQNQVNVEEFINTLVELDAQKWVDPNTNEEFNMLDELTKHIQSVDPNFNGLRGVIDTVAKALDIRKAASDVNKSLFLDQRITNSTKQKRPTVYHYGYRADNQFVRGKPVGYLNAQTGTWSFHYDDVNGVPQLVENLTFGQLSNLVKKYGLWVGEVEKDHVIQRPPKDMMSHLQRFSPPMYKFWSMLNRVLGGSDDKLVWPVRQLTGTMLSQQIRQQGISMFLGQIEKAIQNIHGADIRDTLQGKLDNIRQDFEYQISGEPVTGEATLYSMEREIHKLMRESGLTKEKIDDILYAMRAQDRQGELFKNVPIDPLTGRRRKVTDNLTGFWYLDANGKQVQDPDGSQFLATLSPAEQQFAQQLKDEFVRYNNQVLDMELMAGRMTQQAYNLAYGKFYVPLRNESDDATAFFKKGTGRVTKADSPMTHFFSNAKARLKSAENSLLMQELRETLAEYPIDGFIRFNATKISKTDQGKYQQRAQGLVEGNTITFFENGNKYTATIVDPFLSKNLQRHRDAVDRDDSTFSLLRSVGNLTRWYAQVRTQTPAFFITSILRDSTQALLGHQQAFRGRSGLSDSEHMALSFKTIAKAYSSLGMILKSRYDMEKADWRYKMYRKHGGVGHSAQFDLDTTRDALDADVFGSKDMFGKAKQGLTSGRKKYMDLMHSSDDAIRYATWMTFLEHKAGRKFTSEADLQQFLANNPEVSALATEGSKNITGNFQNKGLGNQFERNMFMFWNANMVGLPNSIRSFNPRYGMAGIKMASIFGGLLAMQALMAGSTGDDDDGKSKFFRLKGIGDWIGTSEDGGLAIPVEHGLRPYTHGILAFTGLITGNYTVGQAVKKAWDGAIQGLTPFSPSQTGDALFDSMYAVLPTILQAPALRMKGTDFFGRDAIPRQFDEEGREITDGPNAVKFRDKDSDFSIAVAHAMNHATNGFVDITPGSVEDLQAQLFGGFYTMVKTANKEYAKSGDLMSAMGAAVFKGKTAEYNSFALQEEVQNRIAEARKQYRLGESVDDMLTGASNLPEEYQELVALDKELRNELKFKDEEGNSVNSLKQREKQLRMTEDKNPQELFMVQEKLAALYAKRNQIYGEFMRKLDELGVD
nr:MAG TPA: Large polyvalent protein associated domain 38 [Caudoviricetes sp.]